MNDSMDILFFLSFFLFALSAIAIASKTGSSVVRKMTIFGVAIITIFIGVELYSSPLEVVSGSLVTSNSSIVNITTETRSFTYTAISPSLNNFFAGVVFFFGFVILTISALFLWEERNG